MDIRNIALFFVSPFCAVGFEKPPNIVFIMADDFGWNDVSWNNPQMPTPNLHKLAMGPGGVLLNNSYVNFLCSQTRSAFMTGHYTHLTGMQHSIILPLDPTGVPVKFPFFPQYLKVAGYRNYMVGKWHLGFCQKSFTPLARGFDKFYGYFNGAEDYYTHTRAPYANSSPALDFWDMEEPAVDKNGTYSTVGIVRAGFVSILIVDLERSWLRPPESVVLEVGGSGRAGWDEPKEVSPGCFEFLEWRHSGVRGICI